MINHHPNHVTVYQLIFVKFYCLNLYNFPNKSQESNSNEGATIINIFEFFGSSNFFMMS